MFQKLWVLFVARKERLGGQACTFFGVSIKSDEGSLLLECSWKLRSSDFHA